MNACPRCGKRAVSVVEAIRAVEEDRLVCRSCGCNLYAAGRPLASVALEAGSVALAWLVLIGSCLLGGYPVGRALLGLFVLPFAITLSFRALARPLVALSRPGARPVARAPQAGYEGIRRPSSSFA